MNKIHLLQLGFGNVGKAFVKEVEAYNNSQSKICYSWIDIKTSKGSVLNNKSSTCHPGLDPGPIGRSIMLDLTASQKTTTQLLETRKNNQAIILANKIPLIQSQSIFNELLSGPIGFRATVGAGLPVIPEIRSLLDQGDKITKLEACLSGTMGILFSELESGRLFSEIIADAMDKGFTEPDPRIDLSGSDVAKKILILSRLSGYSMEYEDLKQEKLYPDPMEEIELDQFISQLFLFDQLLMNRMQKAQANNQTLRYVATLENGQCSVGIKTVLKNSPLGQLENDQKRILIYTDKSTDPIIITGAGSGPVDTAKDLIKDLIDDYNRDIR